VSLRISLDDSNCDGPSAQGHSKDTHAQDVFWTVGLIGLYPLPAEFHHVPEGPVSEKRPTLERKKITAFHCVDNENFSLPGTSEQGPDYTDPQLLIRLAKG